MDEVRFISNAVDDIRDLVCDLSDRIWDYAELGFSEFKSCDDYTKLFASNGFDVECPVANIPTAFTATFGSGRPIIGLLAEYDALSGTSQQAGALERIPVTEGGNGHGCGHNLLGAACLGAAFAVKSYLEQTRLPGTIVVFGCPAEEGGSGKTFMAREGLFENVDLALSWHPADWTGAVPTSAQANIQVRYNFTGVSAHAAVAPECGRSALDAVEIMDVGANYLREHIPTTARLHYAITDTGGTSPNVVQSNATVVYLVRAETIYAAREIKERLDDVARGAALITGTTVDIEFVKASSHLNVNDSASYEVARAMNDLGAPQFSDEALALANAYSEVLDARGLQGAIRSVITRMKKNNPELERLLDAPLFDYVMPFKPLPICAPGSTDVSDVSLNCPTAMFMATTETAGTVFHSWQMTSQGKSIIAHTGMIYSAKVMALTAARYLSNPQLLEDAWREYRASMDGKPYECPIPKDTPLPNINA